MTTSAATDYDLLLDLVQRRTSVRKLKPDPIPDEYVERILEVARWAMSGANSQPWEYIVVKDPATKDQLFQAYNDVNTEYNYWMEQQRLPELRHPSYQMMARDPAERARQGGWAQAPVLIAVVGDGRRQWGTIMGAHTFGRDQSHLTDGLSNTCTLIHLAAASLGLGAQWVSIHIQEPFKRILKVPDIMTFYLIIPIGYPAAEPKSAVRRELQDVVHHEQYDLSKHMSNEDVLKYLHQLRQRTIPKYREQFSGGTGE